MSTNRHQPSGFPPNILIDAHPRGAHRPACRQDSCTNSSSTSPLLRIISTSCLLAASANPRSRACPTFQHTPPRAFNANLPQGRHLSDSPSTLARDTPRFRQSEECPPPPALASKIIESSPASVPDEHAWGGFRTQSPEPRRRAACCSSRYRQHRAPHPRRTRIHLHTRPLLGYTTTRRLWRCLLAAGATAGVGMASRCVVFGPMASCGWPAGKSFLPACEAHASSSQRRG